MDRDLLMIINIVLNILSCKINYASMCASSDIDPTFQHGWTLEGSTRKNTRAPIAGSIAILEIQRTCG